MGRFLFVVPPLTGHVNPTLPVAAELVRRGHEVAWTGLPGRTELLLPEGARFFSVGGEEWSGAVDERFDQQAIGVEGIAEATERHREAAFVVGVAPGLGPPDRRRHLDG
mgnify:CR=1 FL=1